MIGVPYALLGVGLVVVGLGGYAAYQKQRAEAADARASVAEIRAEQLSNALEVSEEEAAKARAAKQALDAAIVDRDKRAKALEAARRKLAGELDALKKTLPQEDQSCLDRPLPPAVLERLRNP